MIISLVAKLSVDCIKDRGQIKPLLSFAVPFSPSLQCIPHTCLSIDAVGQVSV